MILTAAQLAVQIFPTLLTGPALEWFYSLDTAVQCSWPKIKAHLVKQIGPETKRITHRALFSTTGVKFASLCNVTDPVKGNIFVNGLYGKCK